MKESPLVEKLVDKLLNAQTTPEEVCKTCPKMLPKVRARWQRLCHVRDELDALFPPALKSNALPDPLPLGDPRRCPEYRVTRWRPCWVAAAWALSSGRDTYASTV